MNYYLGMSPVERECYKINVAWLKRQPEVIRTFHPKLKEAQGQYEESRIHRVTFLKMCANKNLTEEKELNYIILPFVEQHLEKAAREVRKWNKLLATPKEDGTLEKAKQAPIEGLYDFQKIQRSTGRLKALCPFHEEKSPSFVVYIKENRWWCFGGCGTGGDAIDFIKKRDNCGTREAIDILNDI